MKECGPSVTGMVLSAAACNAKNCLLGHLTKLSYSAQSKTPTTTKSNLQLAPTRCVSRLTHARNVLQRDTHAHIHHQTLAMQAVSFWVNTMPSIRSSFREVVTDKQLLTALHWRQQQNKQQHMPQKSHHQQDEALHKTITHFASSLMTSFW